MWYALNKNLETISIFNTGASLSMPVLTDSLVQSVEKGSRTLNFSVPSDYIEAKDLKEDNYVVVPNPNGLNHYLFRIAEVESINDGVNPTTVVFAESSHVSDLTTDIVRPYNFTSQNLQQVLTSVLSNSDWELRDVEYSSIYTESRTDYKTVLETVFDFVEREENPLIEFVVEMRGGSLLNKYVDVKKSNNESKAMFSFEKNITNISRKINVEEVYTAIVPIGPSSDSNGYMTIAGITSSVTIPNGYEIVGGDGIGHIESKETYSPRQHKIKVYQDSDAQNPIDLFNRSIKELDLLRTPKIEYNCSVEVLDQVGYRLEDFNKGDYVTIKDHQFDLFLEAQITSKQTSSSDVNSGSIALSNFKKLDVNQSVAIKKIQEKLLLKEQVWDSAQEKANDAFDMALEAKDLADSSSIIKSDIAPQDPKLNQLWMDTSSSPNIIFRWDGSAWIKSSDEGFSPSFSNIPPANPKMNELWLDISATPNLIYRWDGSTWIGTTTLTADQIVINEEEPLDPVNNQLWLNTNENPNILLRWDSIIGEWLTTSDDKESIIQAVTQSEEISNMFNNKADSESLDIYAIKDDVNNKFDTIESNQIANSQALDNRVQPLESQIGTIESTLETLPGELALRFATNASGINLLKNSVGWANSYSFRDDPSGNIIKTKLIDFWTYGTTALTGSSIATEIEFGRLSSYELEGYGSAWSASGSGGSNLHAKSFQQVSSLIVGSEYTIGALFKKSSSISDEAIVRVYYYDSVSSSFKIIKSAFGLSSSSPISSEWKFASISFDAPSSIIYVQLDIVNSETQSAAITSLMMNAGNLPYGWTLHNEELYSTGVSFNINGIKVATGRNYTQMTANDFSGYILDGIEETPRRMFSLNGDTTEVANLEAEDEIRLGSLKIKMKNGGWAFMRN